jgi:hypothetical protein
MKYLAQTRAWRYRRSAGALTVAALASGAMTLALANVPAQASQRAADVHYTFRTLNNQNDPTFNQLLGINDSGKIAGYFGSGVKGHPNKGYLLLPPYKQTDYRNQNFPHSKQTQVTGLNNTGIDVGFFSTMNKANPADDNNFGFYSRNGSRFHKVDFPAKHPASPPVDQLLGVNDAGIAVGFYNDSSGNSHGYTYNIATGKYSSFSPGVKGESSVTATAINDAGCIAGFFTSSKGAVHGFVTCKQRPLRIAVLVVPGASMTQPFGISSNDEVVGTYTVGSGTSAETFGFTWRNGHGFQTKISDPKGVGTTVINGVNSFGDLVGFYVGKGGDTNGLLAKP